MFVFDEPQEPSPEPINSYGRYLRHSRSADAIGARAVINSWYAEFPDNSGQVLGNLHGNEDRGIQQAIDELYVHHLLENESDVRYEEERRSPDFRIYRDSNLVGGIEVLSLFDNDSFDSDAARSFKLIDEINKRVLSSTWWVSVTVTAWRGQPRYKEISDQLRAAAESRVAELGTSLDEVSDFIYTSPVIDIKFKFLPRSQDTVREPSGIVGMGPAIGGFLGVPQRLRASIRNKGGNRYEHYDRPFAVFVAMRTSYDSDDIINALFGDDGVIFTTDDPGSAIPHRQNNGLFGLSANNPNGRNRRISCVFVAPGWVPSRAWEPRLTRFDNPFAQHSFPDDILTVDDQFLARRRSRGIGMIWRSDLHTDDERD